MAFKWPCTQISGILSDPELCRIMSCASFPHRSITSFALHFRKTSPTKSAFKSVRSWEPGKCHGELNVSVSARCCSAMTRREILYLKTVTSYNTGTEMERVRTARKSVFMNSSITSGGRRPRHSRTPIASLGIATRCSLRVVRRMSQNLSLSSTVLISGMALNLSNAL